MGKVYYIVLLALFLLFINPNQALGDYDVAENSSSTVDTNINHFDYKEVRLKSYLSTYNSPLSNHADDFVDSSTKYDLDWRLVTSITGVESTFAKHMPSNSYNAYGWANGKYSFESWEDSIDHVSETLRTKYMNKGADDVYKIGRIYAPPSTTWASKVDYFMNKIDPLPLEFSL